MEINKMGLRKKKEGRREETGKKDNKQLEEKKRMKTR